MKPQPKEQNSHPTDAWDAAERLLNCNRQQLADRLGLSRFKLAKLRTEPIQPEQQRQLAALITEAMHEAGAPYLAPVQPQAKPTQAGTHQRQSA